MAKIADYTIVMPQKATENERRAAAFIRENIRLVCGKKVPLVTDDAGVNGNLAGLAVIDPVVLD